MSEIEAEWLPFWILYMQKSSCVVPALFYITRFTHYAIFPR